ncbi:hypothetical protein HI113_43505, partial [Corallococcus exiguus]|uniref:hypothetical protein n=1 Tax=Corallococcus exiguus TaxID=83462 RepID=UPI0018429FA7
MSRSLKLSLAAFSVALVLAGILVAGAAFIEGAYALAGLAAAVFFGAAIGIPLVVGGQIVRFIKGLSVTPPSSSGAGLVGWRSALGEPIRQSDLLEERIERLRVSERLDAVNRLKGGVAHDLNNKLMVISANVDAVAKQLSDRPALERKLASALVACDQAATLISKVLTFTRRHEQQVQVIDVSRQIASVAMLLGRSFRTSAIEVRCLLPEKLWTVRVDPE